MTRRHASVMLWIFLTLTLLIALAVPLCAESSQAYGKQGDALQENGKFVDATRAYDRAIELDPKCLDAYVHRGQCNRQLDPPDLDASLADFNKAIEIDPKSYTAYNGRGITYKDMKKYDLALSDYGRAIEIDPKNYKAYYNRGYLRFTQQNYKGAESDYSRAVECDPSYTFSYSQRARARQALGDREGALADYGKSIALAPHNADAYHYRSSLKHETDDLQGALSDARKALDINPNSDRYKEQLAKLSGDQSAIANDQQPMDQPGNQEPKGQDPAPSVPITFFPDNPDDTALWNNPDTPWRKGDLPITGSIPATELTSDTGFSDLDFDGYQSSVMATMGSMRLVYGDMTAEEEGRFQAAWSPLIDFPTPKAFDYLNKLNPLLQEFLRLRSVMISTAMQFDESWTEAGIAAGFGNEEIAAGALENANVYKQGLVNLRQRMDAVVQQITEIGDPPNPMAARHRARKKLGQVLALLPLVTINPDKQNTSLGDTAKLTPLLKNTSAKVKLAWSFGDGKTANALKANPVAYEYNKKGTYTVKLVVTDAVKGTKVGEAEAKVTVGDVAPRGRYVLTEVIPIIKPDPAVSGGLGSITESLTTHEDLKDPTKVTGSCSVEYSWTHPPSYIDPKVNSQFTSKVAVKSASGKWGTVVQGFSGEMRFFKADQLKILDQMRNGKFDEVSMMDFVKIASTSFLDQPRLSSDGAFNVSSENPSKLPMTQTWTADTSKLNTKDCPYALAIVRAKSPWVRAYTCYVYKYDATGVQAAIDLKNAEQASKDQAGKQSAVNAAAQAEDQAQRDAIAGHRKTIADYQTSVQSWRAQLASERDATRSKELNNRIIDALTEIQHENDLITSMQTGTIVHNRTVAEDVMHSQLIDTCFRDIQIAKQIQDNALRASNFYKAADNLQGLINILPQAEAAELREWANKKLDTKAMVNRDTTRLKQVTSAVLNVVQGKTYKDEANATEAINSLEEIKWGASTALIVVAPFAAASGVVAGSSLAAQAPSWISTGYGIGTGYIEGGPKQAVITGARFYSGIVDVAFAGMEGYQAEEDGGAAGAAKNIAITLLMRKGSELAAGKIMQGRLKAAQPQKTWKDVVEDANFQQAKKDGESLVKKYQSDQEAFDQMVSKNKSAGQTSQEYIAANADKLAKTKEGKVLRDSLASVESSYTAKMAINEPGVPASTKQGYNLGLETFVERPVVGRTRELMRQRGWNDFQMNQIRHGANKNKVGRDHDLAVQEEGFNPQKGGQQKTLMEFQQELELCLHQAYRENTGNRSSKTADWKGTTSVDPEAYLDKTVLNLNKLREQGIDPYTMLSKDLAEQTGGVNVYKVKTALAKRSREGTAEACRTMSKEIDTKILPSCPKGSAQAKYFQNLKAALDKGATDPHAGELQVFGITGLRLPDLALSIKSHLVGTIQSKGK